MTFKPKLLAAPTTESSAAVITLIVRKSSLNLSFPSANNIVVVRRSPTLSGLLSTQTSFLPWTIPKATALGLLLLLLLLLLRLLNLQVGLKLTKDVLQAADLHKSPHPFQNPFQQKMDLRQNENCNS
jgi:hypothetical protein